MLLRRSPNELDLLPHRDDSAVTWRLNTRMQNHYLWRFMKFTNLFTGNFSTSIVLYQIKSIYLLEEAAVRLIDYHEDKQS